MFIPIEPIVDLSGVTSSFAIDLTSCEPTAEFLTLYGAEEEGTGEENNSVLVGAGIIAFATANALVKVTVNDVDLYLKAYSIEGYGS